MHFVPSRDGLNVPSFDAEYFFFPPLLLSIPLFPAPGPRGRFLEESATFCLRGRLARFRRLPSGFAVGLARGWLAWCFSRRTSPISGRALIMGGFLMGS